MTAASLRAILRRAQTRERSIGDHLYTGYLGVLVVLVVAAPLARAAWLLLVDPAVLAMLAATPASVLPALCLLAGGAALILGATAGPAARTPVLTAILADAPFSHTRAFGGPVLRVCVLGGVVLGAVTASWAWPLVTVGLLPSATAVEWSAFGFALGVVAGTATLVGQRFPQAAPIVGASLVALSLAAGVVPAPVLTVLGDDFRIAALLIAVGAAVISIGTIPLLLNSLHSAALVSTARRRESAIDGAVLLDTAAVADATRSVPHTGRRRRAVVARPRRGGLVPAFLRRDAVGWTRTPGRLLVAAVGLAGAAVLGVFALSTPGLGWLAVPGAVIVYAAAGPFTDGLRLAAEASDAPALYGVSPLTLLGLHLAAPAMVWLTAIIAATVLVVCGVLPAAAILGVLLTGAATLAARVADARKPPLPVAMLAPIVTPFGDMAAANRVIWTLGPVLATAAVGVTASAPLLGTAILGGLILHAVSRWRTARLRS